MILAGERYRQVVAGSIGLGTTESQAISYLAVHGDRGQSELARDLSLTSSASTALVDRLERQGVAERVRHPRDRRRTTIRLTERGHQLVVESQRQLAESLRSVNSPDLPIVSTWIGAIADNLADSTRRVADGEVDLGSVRPLSVP